MRMRRAIGAAVGLLALVALPGVGGAQEFEPRAYAVAPPGLNFIAVVYGHAGIQSAMAPTASKCCVPFRSRTTMCASASTR